MKPYQRILILIVVGWYLILCFGHYFSQRPLWNDEQCVLNSIIQLKPHELFTQPLLNTQAFPRVYLWMIQVVSKPFHQHLLALRFFSLLAMLGAFFVWLRIARLVLVDPIDLILFIGCWCASLPMVYYAAELKPYSMDVFVSGLIVGFLLDQDKIRLNTKSYRMALVFLPLFGLLSYTAIFLLLLPFYDLIRASLNDRRRLSELILYLCSFTLMLGVVYFFDFRVSVHHLMEVYWHDYFISMDSFKSFFITLGKGMNNLIGRRFAENPRWVKIPSRFFIGIGLGYMLVVFWDQFKSNRFFLRSVVSVSAVMFLLQLILAMVRIYPFAVPRLSLFFTPLLFLMTILAMKYVQERQKILGLALRLIFIAYLIFVSMGIGSDVFSTGHLGAESFLYQHSRTD